MVVGQVMVIVIILVAHAPDSLIYTRQLSVTFVHDSHGRVAPHFSTSEHTQLRHTHAPSVMHKHRPGQCAASLLLLDLLSCFGMSVLRRLQVIRIVFYVYAIEYRGCAAHLALLQLLCGRCSAEGRDTQWIQLECLSRPHHHTTAKLWAYTRDKLVMSSSDHVQLRPFYALLAGNHTVLAENQRSDDANPSSVEKAGLSPRN